MWFKRPHCFSPVPVLTWALDQLNTCTWVWGGVRVGPFERLCARVCVHAHHIVQVDVGSSPNELLCYLQIALLCCHHQGSLSVLEQRERRGTDAVTQLSPKPTSQLITLFFVTLWELVRGKKCSWVILFDDLILILPDYRAFNAIRLRSKYYGYWFNFIFLCR